MYNRRFFLILTLALTAFLCGAFTLQAASVKDRMLARIPAINALKDKGIIGENNRGFLEFRSGDRSQQNLISAENQDRKSVYAAIAKQQKVDIALVGKRRAKQISDIGAKGHWFQRPDGAWYRK